MKKFIFSTCIGVLLALTGCQESDELVNDYTGKPITVTANIQGSPESRVVLTPGADENQNPIVRVEWKAESETFNLYYNISSLSGWVTFSQVTGNQFTCTGFPDNAIPKYAVYGNHQIEHGELTYNFSEQDGALNDDDFLMTAENITDLTQPIKFKHKTAILKVTFKQDGLDVDTSVTNFTMSGVHTGVQGNTITVQKEKQDGDIYLFLPISTPYTAGRQFTFSVNVEGETCTGSITIPENMTVEAGKYYTANVALANARGECNLPTGSVFNEAVKSVINGDQNVKTISFVTNSQQTGGTRIGNSRAYALVEGTTLKVYTSEKKFIFNADCSKMFAELYNIKKIKWGSSFSTGSVGNMNYMFKDCHNLTSVSFPESFSVLGVSTMKGMFENCSSITALYLNNFEFRNYITYMNSMFKGCTKLATVQVDSEKFKTGTVFDMSSMFEGCEALNGVPPLQTNYVTNMSNMFKNCYALTNFDVQWSGKNSVDMSGMFYQCNKLKKVSFGSNFMPKVTKMDYMFNLCEVLEYVDLRYFDVSNLNSYENAFLYLGTGLDGPIAQIYINSNQTGIFFEDNAQLGVDGYSVNFITTDPSASNQ